MKTSEDDVREVTFRGRPPRLEFGDDVHVTGIRVGAVVHSLNVRNLTTGETRVSQLLGVPAVAAVVVLLLLAGSLSR